MFLKSLTNKKTIFFLSMIILLILSTSSVFSNDQRYETGVINIDISQGMIEMPFEIKGLIFDSSECANCKIIYPSWRFQGNLKLDSLIYGRDSTIPVIEESQVANISINSPELLNVFDSVKSYKLIKTFPHKTPDDTLYWDPIRSMWHILPDMSTNHKFYFHDTIPISNVLDLLEDVPNLKSYYGNPLKTQDDIEDPAYTCIQPWDPDDPLNDWWLDRRYYDSSGNYSGGINAYHAWGLLDDGERGNHLYIAIIDGCVESTHPVL